jgi:hypothetical protein
LQSYSAFFIVIPTLYLIHCHPYFFFFSNCYPNFISFSFLSLCFHFSGNCRGLHTDGPGLEDPLTSRLPCGMEGLGRLYRGWACFTSFTTSVFPAKDTDKCQEKGKNTRKIQECIRANHTQMRSFFFSQLTVHMKMCHVMHFLHF